MNTTAQPETFSWQSFGQSLALYIAMGILAIIARKMNVRIKK
jgi:hypothetical protein